MTDDNPEMIVIETNDGHFHRCKWLIENAEKSQETPQNSILDIGCSDGFMFRDIEHLNVTETDIENKFPPEYGDKIKFVESDAHNLPFEDKEFSCSILGDMLEHVKDPVQVLKEALRVSKSVFITVPNEWEWDDEKRPFGFAEHVRFYTYESLKKDLKLSEYDEEHTEIIKINGGGWSFFCVSYIE